MVRTRLTLAAAAALCLLGPAVVPAGPLQRRSAESIQDYDLVPSEPGTRFGDTPATWSVTPDGAASYRVPIWTPPGRAGIQPALALSYHSRGPDGLLGVGWSLEGASEIRRCRQTMAQDGANRPVAFDGADRFCLDGRRLLPVAGTGALREFRIEQDPASRVVLHSDASGPHHFEIQRADGTIATYGAAENEPGPQARLEGDRVRVAMPSRTTDHTVETHTRVRYAWALWQVRDRPGNYLRWTYDLRTERGPTGDLFAELLPAAVHWTGFLGRPSSDAGVRPNRRIEFVHEERTDRHQRYLSGFGLLSKHRLREIRAYGPALRGSVDEPKEPEQLLRRYTLGYDTPSTSGRSLLMSVQECGPAGECRTPIRLDWELGCGIGTPAEPTRHGTGCDDFFDPLAAEFESRDIPLPDLMAFGSTGAFDSSVRENLPQLADFWSLVTGDLDADGRDDLLYRVPLLNGDRTAIREAVWRYRLRTDSGFGPSVEAGLPVSKTGAAVEQPRIADLDGDGRIEVISVQRADPNLGTNGSYEAFRFDGRRFRAVGLAASETFQGWWTADRPTLFPAMQIADLTGDGRPELVRSAVVVDPSDPDPAPRRHRWAYRANTSTGSQVALAPYSAVGVTSAFEHDAHTVDTDNDGDVELLVREPGSAGDGSSPQLYAFEADAAGHVARTATGLSGLPFELSNQLSADWATLHWPEYSYFHQWFADLNNDGLKDAVAVRAQEIVHFPAPADVTRLPGVPFVALNTGNGFKPYRPWRSSLAMTRISATIDHTTRRVVDNGLRILDHDRDGRDDILLTDDGARLGGALISRPTLLRSDGTGGFEASAVTGVPIGRTTFINTVNTSTDHGYGRRMTQTGDFNGDGLTDIVQATGTGLRLSLHKGRPPDTLIGVRARSTVPALAIDYQPLTAPGVHRPGQCAYPVRCSTTDVQVVTRMAEDTGARRRSWRWSYAGGATDVRGRGWLGFAATTMTDELTGARWTREFGNTRAVPLDAVAGTYAYPFRELPSREVLEVTDQAGSATRHVMTTTTTWTARADRSSTTPFAYAERVVRQERVGGSVLALIGSSTAGMQVDGLGRPLRRVESRPASPGATPPSAERDEVDITYWDDFSAWLLGGPEDIEARSFAADGRSGVRRWHRTYFPGTGLPRSVENSPEHNLDPVTPTTSDLWSERVLTRDEYGLVRLIQDFDGGQLRETSIGYDERDHTFPSSVTEDTDLVRRMWFHGGLGVPAAAEDANGRRTVVRYDEFGRVRAVDRPDNEDLDVQYRPGRTADGYPGDAVEVRTPVPDPVVRTRRHVIVLDRWGRPARESRPAFDGGSSVVDRVYDRAGRLTRVSAPYRSEGRAAAWFDYSYDNLGRLTSAVQPGSPARRFHYDGLRVGVTDESGAVSYTVRDGRSRVTRGVDVAPDGHEIVSRYSYGPFDQLETVTGPDETVTTIRSDERGRVTAVADPDAGERTTALDGFGLPKWTANGAGERAGYQYDSRGRPTTHTDSEGTVSYVRGAQPGFRDRLQSVVSLDGRPGVAYEYDTAGRRTADLKVIDGQLYGARRSYDSYGRLVELSFVQPDTAGPRLVYSYNRFGFLDAIRRSSAAAPEGPLVWRVDKRDEAGRAVAETFGNGLVSLRAYDAAGRLLTLRTGRPDGQGGVTLPALQDLRYTYDPRGHLRTLKNAVTGADQVFAHDHVGRLTEWTVTQAGETTTWTYGYDDLGNLLTRTSARHPAESVVHTYADPAGRPHLLTTAEAGGQTATFGYDAAGRMISMPGRTMSFTSFDAPARSETVTYVYDAVHDEARRVSSTGAEQITAAAGLVERRQPPGSPPTDVWTVPGPDGGPIAQIMQTGPGGGERTLYLHPDRLGSTEVVSGATGGETERFAYEPFGALRRPDATADPAPRSYGDVRRGFAGYRAVPEAAALDAGARYYQPELARFRTPDPRFVPIEASQAANPYSYGRNSPLSWTDPTGLAEEEVSATVSGTGPGLTFDLYDLVEWLTGLFSDDAVPEAAAAADEPPDIALPATVADTADRQGSHAATASAPPATGGTPGAGQPPGSSAGGPAKWWEPGVFYWMSGEFKGSVPVGFGDPELGGEMIGVLGFTRTGMYFSAIGAAGAGMEWHGHENSAAYAATYLGIDVTKEWTQGANGLITSLPVHTEPITLWELGLKPFMVGMYQTPGETGFYAGVGEGSWAVGIGFNLDFIKWFLGPVMSSEGNPWYEPPGCGIYCPPGAP